MGGKKKVLVVDDEKDVIEYVTMILESAGYEVISADSNESCFESLEKERPDLIILDVMLETVTEGFYIGDKLKYNSKYHSIPVIVLSAIEKHTGFPMNKNSVPADEYLEKPIDPHDLIEAVNKFLK